MTWNYTAKMEQPHAKAVGVNLPISSKQSIEICNFIRGKSLRRAKAVLNSLVKGKEPVPFKRFVRDMGHKPGMRTGRYPMKAGSEILDLLESAEANANAKGLSIQDLFVTHIASQRGRRNWRGGRKGRHKSKSTSVEVILSEGSGEKKKVKKGTKAEKKVEVKTAETKVESKLAPQVEQSSTAHRTSSVEPVQQAAEKPAEKVEQPKEEKVAEKKVEAKPAEQAPVKAESSNVEQKPAEKKEEPKAEAKPVEQKLAEPKAEAKPEVKEGESQ